MWHDTKRISCKWVSKCLREKWKQVPSISWYIALQLYFSWVSFATASRYYVFISLLQEKGWRCQHKQDWLILTHLSAAITVSFPVLVLPQHIITIWKYFSNKKKFNFYPALFGSLLDNKTNTTWTVYIICNMEGKIRGSKLVQNKGGSMCNGLARPQKSIR